MPTNEEIIKKRFGLLPEEIKYATTKEISISKILEMLNEAKAEGYKEGQADSLRFAIAHMRVARSSMCLKDRAILLNEINWLETELKKIEE